VRVNVLHVVAVRCLRARHARQAALTLAVVLADDAAGHIRAQVVGAAVTVTTTGNTSASSYVMSARRSLLRGARVRVLGVGVAVLAVRVRAVVHLRLLLAPPEEEHGEDDEAADEHGDHDDHDQQAHVHPAASSRRGVVTS